MLFFSGAPSAHNAPFIFNVIHYKSDSVLLKITSKLGNKYNKMAGKMASNKQVCNVSIQPQTVKLLLSTLE